MFKVWLAAGLAVVCCALPHAAGAQDPILPYREYAKRLEAAQQVGPLTDAAFGAETSPSNGATKFRVVDIDVPGNNGLPVQLARVFSVEDRTGQLDNNIVGYGDWEMDVPYIDGNFFKSIGWKVATGGSGSNARCSNVLPPASFDPPRRRRSGTATTCTFLASPLAFCSRTTSPACRSRRTA